MSVLRRKAVAISLLVLAVWGVYARLAWADFIMWDDRYMVWDNPRLASPSWTNTAAFWSGPYEKLYTPVPYTIWSGVAALENRTAGERLRAGAFHVLCILLHSGTAACVFLLLAELSGAIWASLAGALLFAIHPLQAEAVGWIATTNGLVCGLFGSIALWQYVKFARHRRRARGWHLAVAGVAYALALLSKPTAVVIPLIALAMDLWVVRRPLRAAAGPIAVALVMAVPIMFITRQVQPVTVAGPPFFQRILIAADSLGFYTQKLIAPVNLTADYERTPQWLLLHLTAFAWVGLAVLALSFLLAWRDGRYSWMRGPLVIIPAALLPVLGFTPFDFQEYSTVADRYMYLPMIGVGLLFALLLARLPKKGAVGLAVCLLGILAVRCVSQVGVWMNTGTLTARQLAFDADSATGHKMRAEWLSSQHFDDAAGGEYRAAMREIEAEGRTGEGGTWYGYGNLLLRDHRYGEAIEIYREALTRMSDDLKPMGHNNLGIALFDMGDRAGARAEFMAALQLAPNLSQPAHNLAALDRTEPTSRPATGP